MSALFQHTQQSPYHISVGAVVVRDGKIAVHKHVKSHAPTHVHDLFEDLAVMYTLMRESIEDGESLEEVALRGMREEFGIEGRVVRYLGSIQSHIPLMGGFEKTTLYVECACVTQAGRPTDDEEAYTEIEWYAPQELLRLFETQERNTKRVDLHEAKIVRAYLQAHTLQV
jgi:NADH pyrophosphatase NudC (nudix superfamily)